MGGIVGSVGGLLGTSSGQKMQADNTQSANGVAGLMDARNAYANRGLQGALQSYGTGDGSVQDVLGAANNVGTPLGTAEGMNALATNPLTGTKFATEQVQNNPILGQLFGHGGELDQAVGKEQELQNQGFQLKPEDVSLYGQESGNIARQFGQQGNATANNLAMRGLGSAPSGASGAMFSGLQGNQNEMLAKAQQQIAQQRVQDTMQRIGQQQNFISSLGNQGENAINQQYGRQSQGAQQQQGLLGAATNAATGQNAEANQSNLGAQAMTNSMKPANFIDMGGAGFGALTGAAGKQAGSNAGNSLFNSTSTAGA